MDRIADSKVLFVILNTGMLRQMHGINIIENYMLKTITASKRSA